MGYEIIRVSFTPMLDMEDHGFALKYYKHGSISRLACLLGISFGKSGVLDKAVCKLAATRLVVDYLIIVNVIFSRYTVNSI